MNVSISVSPKSCLLEFTPFLTALKLPLCHCIIPFVFEHHNSLLPWPKNKTKQKPKLSLASLLMIVVFYFFRSNDHSPCTVCILSLATHNFVGALQSVFCKNIISSTNNYWSLTFGYWSMHCRDNYLKNSLCPHRYILGIFKDVNDFVIIMTSFLLLRAFDTTDQSAPVFPPIVIFVSDAFYIPPSKT